MGQRKPLRASRSRARTESGLTEQQEYWLRHLRSCESSGETLKAYAKRHGLSVHGLYAARKRLRQRGVPLSVSRTSPVSFARVNARVSSAREPGWRVRFPNGAVVEWEVAPEGEALEWLLKGIATLS